MKISFFSHRWIALIGIALTFVSSARAERHTPPPDPKVHPRIGKSYPNDKDADHIEDELSDKAKAAKSREEMEKSVGVNLVFAEQITQEQIDAFENEGGVIGHIYKTISYGWNGTIPLNKVQRLPQVLGATFLLVEEPKAYKLHMINATQTGRIRPIWANNFGGSSSGYDGSTNITIGIIDTGVDVSHTDLAGRKVYWYDYSSTNNTTALDYYGHGTHVAGIAFGTGSVGGSTTAPFSFTLWADLTGVSSNSFYFTPFALPTSSQTWKAGASWNGGGSGTLYLGYHAAGNGPSSTVTTFTTASSGVTPLTTTSIFTPVSTRIYAPILLTPGTNGVTDYAITNYLSSYPAVGDGFNKFRGVAPGCNWAAAKVSSGTGYSLVAANIDDALDDMVTSRSANKIKVINLSLGVIGSPGLDTTQRQYVNTAVANGVVVVVAAGNDGENSTSADREIDDPARAAYAITVGAINPTNQLTSYTSVGFTGPGSTSGQEEDYKPDILAPGGSTYYGAIFSTDSNTKDGGLSDVKSNDYTPDIGTSMAAPFVSGSAALVIDAMEQNGHTWDFNSETDPMYVKMLLCATATESNSGRESSTRSPSLDRTASGSSNYPQGKDQYEGYGLMNPDAAIEAAIVTFTNGTQLMDSMGATISDRRAWARKISLETGKTIKLSLAVPSTGDYDLYLYNNSPGTYGKPQILASSTSASTDTDESISYTPYTNMNAFVVVKRISGSGTFTIGYTNSNDVFTNAFSLPATVAVPYSTGSNIYFYATGNVSGNNSSYSKDTSESSIGTNASGKTAWYNWVSTITGKLALSVPGSFGVEMYTGSSVTALTSVTKDFSSLRSSNNFTITAGTTYRIAVDGTNSNSGAYTLSWSVLSATAMVISNSSTLTYSGSGSYDSPNPASIIISGMTQSVNSVTMKLNNFTASNPHIHEFLVTAPNNKGVVIWGRNGGDSGFAFTNLTLTFDDTSLNPLPDYVATSVVTNGTYHPSCWLTTALTSNWGDGAPSAPYTTNLSDLTGTLSGTWSLYSDLLFTSYVSVITNGWTLNLSLTVPAAPVVSINTTNLSYTENQTATSISSTATVTDSDSTNFNTGNLTVQFTANGASEDRLTLLNQGTGAGQIGVSGTVVSYSGTNFGYYTGGTNGASLIVNFTNTYATPSAVQQLITRVAYTNASENPSTATRTVQFTVTDSSNGNSGTASKNISVAAVNDPPILSQISPLTNATEDTAFTITYTTLAAASDYYDFEGATGSFIVQSVTSGTLKKNGFAVTNGATQLSTGESWVWTPATNAFGTNIAAFQIIATDGTANSTNGNVTVYVAVAAVNDTPTLTTISALTNATEDTAFTISYTTLAAASNISDAETNSPSFRVESVTSGTLKKSGVAVTNAVTLLSSGESWVWTPATNAYGTNISAFMVKAWDGTVASSTAVQVNVAVANVNDAPTLTTITNLTGGTEDIPFTNTYAALWSAANAADVDSSNLSFRVESVTSGTLTKNGTNVLAGTTLLSTNETWIWTPATNVNGSPIAAFTVRAYDGSLTSASAVQVNVNVLAVADAPTLTFIATLTNAVEDTAFTINYTNLTSAADEADGDGDTISFRVETVSSGTLTKNGTNVTSGTLLSSGESFVWTPAANVNGTNVAAFTVKAWDGALASSSAVQVTVNVTAVNDAPTLSIGTNDLYYIENDVAIIATNVVLNDIDSPDFSGGSLKISLSSAGGSDRLDIGAEGSGAGQIDVSGTTVLYEGSPIGYYSGGVTNNSDLVISFTNSTATIAAVQALIKRITFRNLLDNFGTHTRYVTFTASNSDGASASASKFIYVVPVNDAPTISTISTLTGAMQDTPFTINYTNLAAAANEADVEGDPISFRVETITSGTLTKNGTNAVVGSTLLSSGEDWVWTPATNVSGSAVSAFVVSAWDGALASTNSVQVKINVVGLNSAPAVAITSPTTNDIINAGSTNTISASATDTDGTISKVEFYVGANKLGEVSGSPYSILWTNVYAGTFSLTAKATDNGNSTTTSSAVAITVNPYLRNPEFSSQFSTIFYGASNSGYTVEYSTDLSGWSTLTNIVITNGGFVLTDPTNTTQRYYRVHANE